VTRRNRSNSHSQAKKDRQRRQRTKREATTKLPLKPQASSKPSSGSVINTWSGKTWYKKLCDHWQQPFDLDCGTVYASAYQDRPSPTLAIDKELRDRTFTPAVGFYLDGLWASGGIMVTPGSTFPAEAVALERVIYPWPDYGVPASLPAFCDAITWLLDAIGSGRTVEVGCFASHGRTGSLLASLLVAEGMEAHAAIRQVRRVHCDEAVESMAQISFIERLDTRLNGREHKHHVPRKRTVVDKYVDNIVRHMTDDDAADYETWQVLQAKQLGLGIYADSYDDIEVGYGNTAWEPTREEQCSAICAIPPCGSPYQCDGESPDGCMARTLWPEIDSEV